MTVQGQDIPQAVQTACLKRAKQSPFKAAAISETAIHAGLTAPAPKYGITLDVLALRVADRLIQTWRKQKLIRLQPGNFWKYQP